MTHPVVTALRARVDWRTLLAGAAVTVFLLALDVSLSYLATTAAVVAITGTTSVLSDAYDLRESVEHAGIGTLGLFYGGATVVFGDEPLWFAAGFLLVGGWFVFDAVQTVRHEGATVPDDDRDGHDVYQADVTRRVHEALRDQPRTRREIRGALDAEDRYVDTAVARLLDREAVVERGSELRVPETDTSASTRVRRWLLRVGKRVLRPLTVEFSGATDDQTDRPAP